MEVAHGERFETPIIRCFREHYHKQASGIEIPHRSLISKHDPTIRFTNSTTSVMKPLLNSRTPIESVYYMAQPALGTQGLDYWQNNHKFGIYASYFMSLGAIYPLGSIEELLSDTFRLTEDWRVPLDIKLEAYDYDLDIVERLNHTQELEVQLTSVEQHHRHSYGLPDLSGRNINLTTSLANGPERVIGNITLISNQRKDTAWELSFDSTTVGEVVFGLNHATEAHHSCRSVTLSESEIAAVDFTYVAAPLMCEGLRPRSRGRNGILKRFMTELIGIRLGMGWETEDIKSSLLDACESDAEMRKALGPRAVNDTEFIKDIAKIIIEEFDFSKASVEKFR